MGLVQQAVQLAGRAREDRNKYVDFLRVLAITAVVVGHWMVIDLQLRNGLSVGANALAESSWTHWVTWAFQVIPIFFLVGGYANAVSWRFLGGQTRREYVGGWKGLLPSQRVPYEGSTGV